MEITKTSILTGISNIMEIPISEEQYNEYLSGESLDIVAPELSRSDKEFIRTGITIEELEETL